MKPTLRSLILIATLALPAAPVFAQGPTGGDPPPPVMGGGSSSTTSSSGNTTTAGSSSEATTTTTSSRKSTAPTATATVFTILLEYLTL
jgi:hypothetical protein